MNERTCFRCYDIYFVRSRRSCCRSSRSKSDVTVVPLEVIGWINENQSSLGERVDTVQHRYVVHMDPNRVNRLSLY